MSDLSSVKRVVNMLVQYNNESGWGNHWLLVRDMLTRFSETIDSPDEMQGFLEDIMDMIALCDQLEAQKQKVIQSGLSILSK